MSSDYLLVQIATAVQYKPNLLLVTATEVETTELHRKMIPLVGDKLSKAVEGANTYYIGKFGAFLAVHVECNMGSSTIGGSVLKTQQSITLFDPTYVVMVGIAFGANKDKQAIGDVLIADHVIPYEIKRIGRDETEHRGPRPPSSPTLRDRFKHCSIACLELSGHKRIPGAMLSGESLYDNASEKAKLLADFPHAVGGEMEGAGLYAAAISAHKEWIIVKGVCDYGDGNKGENKTQYQQLAAKNAIALCQTVFDEAHSFPNIKPSKLPSISANTILFDFYDKSKEPYYYKRSIDDLIAQTIQDSHIWLFGSSGSGKTALARRLVLQSDLPCTVVDLYSCAGHNTHYLLRDIATKLSINFSDTINQADLTTLIVDTLLNYNNRVFLFDEIPIDSDSAFHEFRDCICAIVLGLRNRGYHSPARLVLLSIQNPKSQLRPYHTQVEEKLRFIETKDWSQTDLKSLLQLVSPHLSFTLSQREREILENRALNSPRTLKTKLRAYGVMKLMNKDFSLTEESFNEL